MTTYTNPTGTFNATDGDDTILFNTAPSGTVAIDALGGSDSLTVQVPYTDPISFDATDNGAGSFTATTRLGPYGGLMVVYDVENVEFDGAAANDTFHIQLGQSTVGESIKADGGAGTDLLQLDATKLTSNFSFVANGSSIASTFGTFSNFETFEIHTGSGNDTITTRSGNDSIYTGTGADNVSTGAGNDQIYSQSSSGTIDGGSGSDYFSGDFSAQGNLSTTIGSTISVSNGLTVTNVESYSLRYGFANDHVTVNGLQISGSLYGGSGSDTLTFGGSDAGIKFPLKHIQTNWRATLALALVKLPSTSSKTFRSPALNIMIASISSLIIHTTFRASRSMEELAQTH